MGAGVARIGAHRPPGCRSWRRKTGNQVAADRIGERRCGTEEATREDHEDGARIFPTAPASDEGPVDARLSASHA